MKEFELTYFVKKRANPSWHLDNDQLPFCDLTFLLDGEATYSNNRQTFHLLPGEAVFLPAGSKRFATTTGMECVAFSFAADAWPFSGASKICWTNDSLLRTYFEDFNQCWSNKSPIGRMRCDGLFLLILSRLLELQQQQQSNPYVTRIKDYLLTHYAETITVEAIAREMQLNPVYCGALFSQETGQTILQYTNRLRITKAKELLHFTNDSVSEIAAEVGIEDLYYFSRLFKKLVGMSPSEYRKRA